jgi:hypothetical protein
MSDGNLKNIFRAKLPEAHWQPVETWSTGQGVPDVEYCFPGGFSGWIENKLTAGWRVKYEPHQVGWLERRARMGGRCFVAVRRRCPAGPHRGPACDELWLFPGSKARLLLKEKMVASEALGIYSGGPAQWNWAAIKKHLTTKGLDNAT